MPRLFINPKIIHLTLCMLPLETEEQVEIAREAMRSVEEQIKKQISEFGKDGKLVVEFEDLHYFGKPDDTRVVYMKLKEDGE